MAPAHATLPVQYPDASAFSQAVHARQPHVAVFDCDGTLWSGDAGSTFMRWTMETGLLSAERSTWLTNRYELYRRGEVSELAICGEMVQVYAGLHVEDLRTASAKFFTSHVEPNIFPALLQLVNDLNERGVEVWAVSSTCDWVIEEGVKRFNIPPHRVLAAHVHCEAGLATDRLLDVPTDEGKVAALRRVGITHPDAVFGNSVHDGPMLRIARGAFPVNPSAALEAEALLREWPVFHPQPRASQ